jgi:hypothetical protein
MRRVKPLRINFHKVEDTTEPIQEFNTNIMGHFTCTNPACSSEQWNSKKIATNIRLYEEDLYNARIFHQRCQFCETLCKPIINKETYIERVAYRLRKWHGMEVKAPNHGNKKDDNRPHLSRLCEGCRAGYCKEGDRNQSD